MRRSRRQKSFHRSRLQPAAEVSTRILALGCSTVASDAVTSSLHFYWHLFLDSDDVILNESFSDEEPPPLPEYSPPSSPCLNEIDIGGERGGVADEEGIYQEPMEWLVELEEIQRKRKLQNIRSPAVVHVSGFRPNVIYLPLLSR